MTKMRATVACLLLLSACKKEEAAQPTAAAPEGTKAPASQPAAAPVAAAPAAGPKKKESDDACVGSPAQTTKGTFEINGQTYERNGAVLKKTSSDPDDQVILGVISDIKEEAPENLKNIKAA